MFEIDPRVRENVVAWGGAAGRRWLAGLPELVTDLTRRWELSGFGPVPPGWQPLVGGAGAISPR